MENNTFKTNLTVSKELKARRARASLLEKYYNVQNTSGQNSNDSYFMANMSSILKELDDAATCNSDESENVIQLQLSDMVDKFIRKLKPHEQIIYIRRYFYADTIENIAASCDLSADKLVNILRVCNDELNSILSKDQYLISTSTLFQCFTDIQDDLISFGSDMQSINNYLNPSSSKGAKKLNMAVNKYSVIIVAIFVIAIIVIISIIPSGDNTQNVSENGTLNNSESNTSNGTEYETSNHAPVNIDEYKHIFGVDEDGTYVITHELMNYEEINNRLQQSTDFNKNNCKLSYYPHKLTVDTDILKYCLGTLNEDFSNETSKYYTLLGHEDFYYLIQEQNGVYTLFRLYEVTPTGTFVANTFEKTLKEFYGIGSADDIEKIQIAPMSIDLNVNFKPEELLSVDDYDSIDFTCLKLKNMEFTDKEIYEYLPDETMPISVLNDLSMRLIIYTKKGGLITSLCYNFSNHYFYDCYGTRFSILSVDASQTLDEIFKFSDVIDNATVWDTKVHKVSVGIQEITSTRIGLIYENHGQPIDGLYVSNVYKLEQLIDGEWVTVPQKANPFYTLKDEIFSSKIPASGTTLCTFNINNLYGRLSAGEYRIVTSVCNLFTYNTKNHVEQLYYTKFNIK